MKGTTDQEPPWSYMPVNNIYPSSIGGMIKFFINLRISYETFEKKDVYCRRGELKPYE